MFQTQGTGGGLSVLVLQMAAIGLVFYFLILRPSSQARKKHAELLGNLKKGDEVMTSGGIIGKVRDIREVESDGAKETRVTIESGTASFIVERSRIVRIGGASAPSAPGTPAA
jgi:preprotein translocase subunit YajC